MPVPKSRRSRSKRDRMRTHKKLKATGTTACPSCGKPKMPHNACTNPDCGMYRGRRITPAKTT